MKTVSKVLKDQFGSKVLKLSLNAGCTCPNRDGTKGYGGCSFCTEGGSGEFASAFTPLAEQIREAKKKVDGKFPKDLAVEERRYIAYFQPFTNTYGDQDRLKHLFQEALSYPEIVVLSIATRPDCLSDEMVCFLSDLNQEKPVWVELGLQTIHERTAQDFGRGYTLDVFEDAYRRLKEAGLTVIVHVILGLPGETCKDMLDTVRYLAALSPTLDGIKIQMLQILKGSRLAETYEKEPFPLLSMDEYVELASECVRLLPEETVLHRLTGDPPWRLLIAPKWCTDKKRVWNRLRDLIGTDPE